jgi:hypothetical protein
MFTVSRRRLQRFSEFGGARIVDMRSFRKLYSGCRKGLYNFDSYHHKGVEGEGVNHLSH